MFKRIIERLEGKVDKKAEAKKRGIEYIALLAEENKEILLENIGEGFDEYLEEKMYSLMEDALDYVGKCYMSCVSHSGTEDEARKHNKLYVDLGFIKLHEFPLPLKKEKGIIATATEKGINVYDRHQEVQIVLN